MSNLHIIPQQSGTADPLNDHREAEPLLRMATERGGSHVSELFDEYQPLRLSFVVKITRDTAAREEIVQDIFLKISMSKENQTKIRSFGNYSFTLSLS